MDRKTANAITALSSSDIRQMLGDKLSKSEVRAAISCHQGVTEHIAELSEQGRVIDSNPWWQLGLGKSKWAKSSVQNLFTAENSYVGRDREIALTKQARDRTRAAIQH